MCKNDMPSADELAAEEREAAEAAAESKKKDGNWTELEADSPFGDLGRPECEPLGEEKQKSLLLEFAGTRELTVRNRLVAANLRFVASRAATFRRCVGLPFSALPDIFQHGAIGLIKAIEKFDAFRYEWLLALVSWEMKNELREAYAHCGPLITLSLHRRELLMSVLRMARERGWEWRERIPELAIEVAKQREWSEEKAVMTLSEMAEASIGGSLERMSPARLERVYRFASAERHDPEQIVERMESIAYVRRNLGVLEPRAVSALLNRFADDSDHVTRETLGAEFGCSRTTIENDETRGYLKVALSVSRSERQCKYPLAA